jgi:hypothetical protein
MPELTNNTAFYVVYSCPTGSVWINEFNVADSSDLKRYVEVCGRSDASIRNWRLEVFNGSGTTNAIYGITNATPSLGITNGFGFWVVGNSATSPRSETLTNDLPAPNGGFRLMRSCGAAADALSYGMSAASVAALTNIGMRYIGTFDDDWFDTPVALIGSNTNHFEWSNYGPDFSYSPGAINLGQYLVGASVVVEHAPPDIEIIAFWVNTNVWIKSTITNNWYATLWQSTNLVSSNAWVAQTNITLTQPSTTNVLMNLPLPTNSMPRFYKVVATNSP